MTLLRFKVLCPKCGNSDDRLFITHVTMSGRTWAWDGKSYRCQICRTVVDIEVSHIKREER